MGLSNSVSLWAAAAFAASFFITVLNASNQAIWQAKVAPDVQGRVFSVRRLIAQVAGPLGVALAGPLADRVFEPAMMSGGSLAPVFGGLVGVGPGAGMSLMFVVTGLAGALLAALAFAVPSVRNVEQLLPDHVAADEPLQDADATPLLPPVEAQSPQTA